MLIYQSVPPSPSPAVSISLFWVSISALQIGSSVQFYYFCTQNLMEWVKSPSTKDWDPNSNMSHDTNLWDQANFNLFISKCTKWNRNFSRSCCLKNPNTYLKSWVSVHYLAKRKGFFIFFLMSLWLLLHCLNINCNWKRKHNIYLWSSTILTGNITGYINFFFQKTLKRIF